MGIVDHSCKKKERASYFLPLWFLLDWWLLASWWLFAPRGRTARLFLATVINMVINCDYSICDHVTR